MSTHNICFLCRNEINTHVDNPAYSYGHNVSFLCCDSYVIYSKNISVYTIFNDQSFNEIVSFKQLGPGISLCFVSFVILRCSFFFWSVYFKPQRKHTNTKTGLFKYIENFTIEKWKLSNEKFW